MKKIGDYMKEIGFNPTSSDEAKKSFIKYLMRESAAHERVARLEKYRDSAPEAVAEDASGAGPVQLSFDLTGTE